MFTRGGPLSSTTTLPVFIYNKAFIARELGEASAAAVLLFLILVVFAIVYFVTLRPSEEIETGR
jgi:ABC-type sugar transport system permease subunit